MNSTYTALIALALVIGGGVGYALWRRRRAESRSLGPRRDTQPPQKFITPPPPPVRRQSPGLKTEVVGQNASPDDFPMPRPVHGASAIDLSHAENRAIRHLEACSNARNRKNLVEAKQHAEKAAAEVRRYLKVDHWFQAELLNMLGCIKYDEGFYLEARNLWECAENVASEWPDKCSRLIPTIESNLKLVRGTLGF
jgi:hypothetical protein